MAARKAVKKTSRGQAKKAGPRSRSTKKKKTTSKTSKQTARSRRIKDAPEVHVHTGETVGEAEYEGLTALQSAFVNELMLDNNGAKALIRAGGTPTNAKVVASRMLTDVNVKRAVEKARAARAERINISADRVLLELARVGLADARDLFVWDQTKCAFVPSKHLTEDQAAAIQAVESESTTFRHPNGIVEVHTKLKLRTHSKVEALKEIGKHLGVSEHLDLNVRDPNSALSDVELAAKAKKLAAKLAKSKGK